MNRTGYIYDCMMDNSSCSRLSDMAMRSPPRYASNSSRSESPSSDTLLFKHDNLFIHGAEIRGHLSYYYVVCHYLLKCLFTSGNEDNHTIDD